MALLEADVNFKVVRDLIGKIKERAVGQEVLDSLTPAQHVIKIVNDELTALMGGHAKPDHYCVAPTNRYYAGGSARGR